MVDWSLIGTDAESELVQQWGKSLAAFGFVLVRNYFTNSPPKASQSLANLEQACRKFFEKNPFSVKKHFQLHEVFTVQGYGGPGEICVSGGSNIKRRAPDAVETIHCACMVDELEKTATQVVPNPMVYVDPSRTPIPGSDDCELRNANAAWYRTAHEDLVEKALFLTRKYFCMSEENMKKAMEGGTESEGDAHVDETCEKHAKKRRMNVQADAQFSPIRCFGRVSINRYLPIFQENQLCYGEHVDSSMLTFVWRSAWNGLQFLRKRSDEEVETDRHSSDEWIDIPHEEDLILVNAGATLEAMTNGHVKGVIHRVLGPQSKIPGNGQQKSYAAQANSVHAGSVSYNKGEDWAPDGWPITLTFFLHPANDAVLHPFKSNLVEEGLGDQYKDTNTKKPFTSLGLRKFKVQRMELCEMRRESKQ